MKQVKKELRGNSHETLLSGYTVATFLKKKLISINEIDENNLTRLKIITYYRSLTKGGKFIQLALLSCAYSFFLLLLVSACRRNSL